ncbi:MAG: nucleotidyltransferase domain-containing protein [Candidatus Omnitrophota bacterium]
MISLRSKNTKAILGHMFLHEDAELYVNEMARKFSLDDGNLSRKLKELESEGILKCRESGSACYYSLNRDYPLLNEYKGIVLKTVGLEQKLRDVVSGISGIEKAFIFGSYAGGKMDAASDIDVLVVGGHDTLALQRAVGALQKESDREINVISIGTKEYREKIKKDPFLKSLAKKKKVRLL